VPKCARWTQEAGYDVPRYAAEINGLDDPKGAFVCSRSLPSDLISSRLIKMASISPRSSSSATRTVFYRYPNSSDISRNQDSERSFKDQLLPDFDFILLQQ